MTIRKWLWPKLESTEDADRELRVVARIFYVVALATLIRAGSVLIIGGDLFLWIFVAALFGYLALQLHKGKSRTAAVILGLNAVGSTIMFIPWISNFAFSPYTVFWGCSRISRNFHFGASGSRHVCFPSSG